MDGQLPSEIRLSLDRECFLEDEGGQADLEQWLDTGPSTYPDGFADDFDTIADRVWSSSRFE